MVGSYNNAAKECFDVLMMLMAAVMMMMMMVRISIWRALCALARTLQLCTCARITRVNKRGVRALMLLLIYVACKQATTGTLAFKNVSKSTAFESVLSTELFGISGCAP